MFRIRFKFLNIVFDVIYDRVFVKFFNIVLFFISWVMMRLFLVFGIVRMYF